MYSGAMRVASNQKGRTRSESAPCTTVTGIPGPVASPYLARCARSSSAPAQAVSSAARRASATTPVAGSGG